ncbi:MAG: hypothetical protein AB1435_12045 [Chloroflexota bacterium]
MGNQFLILAIVVIVIGGMGSFEGTAIASIVVGLTRAVAEQLSLAHFNAPVLAETSVLLLMIVVLLVQPNGLFGRGERWSSDSSSRASSASRTPPCAAWPSDSPGWCWKTGSSPWPSCCCGASLTSWPT